MNIYIHVVLSEPTVVFASLLSSYYSRRQQGSMSKIRIFKHTTDSVKSWRTITHIRIRNFCCRCLVSHSLFLLVLQFLLSVLYPFTHPFISSRRDLRGFPFFFLLMELHFIKLFIYLFPLVHLTCRYHVNSFSSGKLHFKYTGFCKLIIERRKGLYLEGKSHKRGTACRSTCNYILQTEPDEIKKYESPMWKGRQTYVYKF